MCVYPSMSKEMSSNQVGLTLTSPLLLYLGQGCVGQTTES